MSFGHVAKNAGLDPGLQHGDAAARVALISHLAGEPGLLLQRHEVACLGDTMGQGLFEIDRLAGLQTPLGKVVMSVIGRGDDDPIDRLAVLIQHPTEVRIQGHSGMGFARRHDAAFIHIRKSDEVDEVVAGKTLDRGPAFASCADEGDVQAFVGPGHGAREDKHAGEGSGGLGEELAAVEHD
jgi:hypothetical protein